jgi:hypothetical protein
LQSFIFTSAKQPLLYKNPKLKELPPPLAAPLPEPEPPAPLPEPEPPVPLSEPEPPVIPPGSGFSSTYTSSLLKNPSIKSDI